MACVFLPGSERIKKNNSFGYSSGFSFGTWCLFVNCLLGKWKSFREESSLLSLTLFGVGCHFMVAL